MDALLFSSVIFLYGFLPLTMLIYFITKPRYRNLVLLIASNVFYFFGEPSFLPVMLFTALLGFGFGLLIDRTRSTTAAKPTLWISIATCLLPLLFFKYTGFFVDNISALLGFNTRLPEIILPIGISFYTFQIISYLVDVYRSDTPVQRSIVSYLTYVTLFPQLIAGPIVRYQTIEQQLSSRTHSLPDISSGITRFCVGLGKKVIIADSLFALAEAVNATEGRSVLACWVSAAAFTLQVYFDFSGYSDMAIGLGRLFGFSFPENFNYPYISQSVTEFWRRWHISLGSWFRDYVYIPLGGNRCSRAKWIRNILVVWLLTGFWHGAAWSYIVWGLYFAVFLLLEKLCIGKLLGRLPTAVRVVYTLLVLLFGFVIFSADSLSAALISIKGMLGVGIGAATDSVTLYYLSSFAVLLLVSTVGATPLPKQLAQNLCRTRLGATLEPLFCIAVLTVSTAYLVEGTFSPFLYFRF